MSEPTLKIKPIHEGAIPAALEKAERYRLLNDPTQAESICRDVLRVRPDHRRALTIIVLALTDRFASDWGSAGVHNMAREFALKLTDEYERLYYEGLISERHARALLRRSGSRSFAYDGLRQAMGLYEQAERVRPEGNDDAILRWNSCVRTIRRERLGPDLEQEEILLLE
jgi:hypothetical protein